MNSQKNKAKNLGDGASVPTPGTVYLVGAGPGDPRLITVRGLDLIGAADVIVYDFLASRELLQSAREDAEVIYVGKQASLHELSQQGINDLLIEKARQHGIVVRLKGGDPFVFGRGGEEALALSAAGVPFEVVPGVSSAIAVPAYAGIPPTHRGLASTVAFITGHEDAAKRESTIPWAELTHGADTLVFLMGMKNIADIRRNLLEQGKDPQVPVAVIEWGTTPRQKVVEGTLIDIDVLVRRAGLKPPAVIVVGDVVALRGRLRWYERRPLFGKRIAITRAPHQSLRLARALSEKGAEPVFLPTIAIEPIEPNEPLRGAIEGLDGYGYVIFTSVNAVQIFFKALFASGRDVRHLRDTFVVAIGPATARSLSERGIRPDAVPDEYTSAGIVEILKRRGIGGQRILLPRAEEAGDAIVSFARRRGAACHVVPIYRTTAAAKAEKVPPDLDVVTFTSSSTVTNFLALYGRDPLKGPLIASIGPVTTKTLRRHRLPVHMEARRSDIPGLVEAVAAYFEKKPETQGH